jgi:hypothetical protein
VVTYFSDDGDQESQRHRASRRWIAATDRHHAEVAWPTGLHRLAAQTAFDQRSISMIVALLDERPGRVSPIGYGS